MRMSLNGDGYEDNDYKDDGCDDYAAKVITVTNSNFHFRPHTGR